MLARQLRIPHVSPRCAFQTRTIISVVPPVVYPKKTTPRIYSERKTYLYNQYTRLFQDSSSAPLIFLQHTDFSIPRLIQLRSDIATAARRHATPPPSLKTPSPGAAPPEPELPTLTIIRTSLFGVALRDFSPIDVKKSRDIANLVTGGLAVLRLPNLNPPQLQAIIKAMSRSVPPRKPKTPEELEQAKKDAEAAFVPGRRPKRQRPVPVPDLKVVGALIEGRVFKAEGVQDVAKLPSLDTLRAQVVGLLSAPATQLAMVLSEASGGKLARTLEGLKKGLEEGQGQSQDAAGGSGSA
ncbi:hypothetical protein NLI96_g5597 [Meripilus lineatus]|uniref:Ribosomal protein L10 n=1 Tax=Meripilus lineatus TaxID=2056292 RepID=A0AAD5V378_9APHY|nr:hypothetical protein NLI96_g5597 [Physisporinus lineatus]